MASTIATYSSVNATRLIEETGAGTGLIQVGRSIRLLRSKQLRRLMMLLSFAVFAFNASSVLSANVVTEVIETPHGRMMLSIDGPDIAVSWHFYTTNSPISLLVGNGRLVSGDYAKIELFHHASPAASKVIEDGLGAPVSRGKVVGTDGKSNDYLDNSWGTLELLITQDGILGLATKNGTAKLRFEIIHGG